MSKSTIIPHTLIYAGEEWDTIIVGVRNVTTEERERMVPRGYEAGYEEAVRRDMRLALIEAIADEQEGAIEEEKFEDDGNIVRTMKLIILKPNGKRH